MFLLFSLLLLLLLLAEVLIVMLVIENISKNLIKNKWELLTEIHFVQNKFQANCWIDYTLIKVLLAFVFAFYYLINKLIKK